MLTLELTATDEPFSYLSGYASRLTSLRCASSASDQIGYRCRCRCLTIHVTCEHSCRSSSDKKDGGKTKFYQLSPECYKRQIKRKQYGQAKQFRFHVGTHLSRTISWPSSSIEWSVNKCGSSTDASVARQFFQYSTHTQKILPKIDEYG